MNINTIPADYSDEKHAVDIVSLLNCYAMDPMGGAAELADYVKNNLVNKLAEIPGSLSILSYVDGAPAGLVNCFEGFSSFKCKPLLNIHDVIVIPEFRGLGICQRMLQLVEEHGRSRGCCKLTLEVLEGNSNARDSYARFGFSAYELDPAMGNALFWVKAL